MNGPIEFKISTPELDFGSHIAHALGLGLGEADYREKTLHLFANGPSACSASLSVRGDTMAVNGALELFTAQALAPTWWIACDPQALVADFLEEMPRATIYLAASKCHPDVFERLKDRTVRLWHVNDHPVPGKRQVPCAVSVTLCALMLAHRLGYRTIHTYGWDCCYDGERHHAASGMLSNTPGRVWIGVGDDDEAFETNPTWACEFQDARGILPVLRWCGTDVIIHGRSLVGAILHEYADAG